MDRFKFVLSYLFMNNNPILIITKNQLPCFVFQELDPFINEQIPSFLAKDN